jgi:hypothetical protein
VIAACKLLIKNLEELLGDIRWDGLPVAGSREGAVLVEWISQVEHLLKCHIADLIPANIESRTFEVGLCLATTLLHPARLSIMVDARHHFGDSLESPTPVGGEEKHDARTLPEGLV